MKVAAIQMNSMHDKSKNLKDAARLITAAIEDESPELILLPEMFTYLGDCQKTRIATAEALDVDHDNTGEAYQLIKSMAQQHQVVIHAGSICEVDNGKYYNTSVVFGKNGQELGRYRKIHLLEINYQNQLHYNETDFYEHGENLLCYNIEDNAHHSSHKVGASICFDLRFPAMYKKMADLGCEIIMIPSAFFSVTGQDHWETLCRARAIETQSYVIAAAQTGQVKGQNKDRHYWGHSMIIDPWGKIMADAGTGVGYICAEIDLIHLEDIRKRLPLRQCQRNFE